MAGMWRMTPEQCTETSPSRASTLSNGTVQKSELQNGALKPGANPNNHRLLFQSFWNKPAWRDVTSKRATSFSRQQQHECDGVRLSSIHTLGGCTDTQKPGLQPNAAAAHSFRLNVAPHVSLVLQWATFKISTELKLFRGLFFNVIKNKVW